MLERERERERLCQALDLMMEAKSDKASFRALSSSPSFSTPTLHTSPLSSVFFSSPRRLLIPPTPQQHVHYSHRAPWLRAAVLGANDGLVSTASLMLGVGGGTESLRALVLAGVAGLVAGALSMAVGEYISVSSQRDAEEVRMGRERGYGGRERWRKRGRKEEKKKKKKKRAFFFFFFPLSTPTSTRAKGGASGGENSNPINLSLFLLHALSLLPSPIHRQADVEKERREQEKGPAARAHELAELAEIYEGRGLSKDLAMAVAKQLTERDVIRAHARDELGIDLDDMSNPLQAAFASSASFTVGAAVPLLASAFVQPEAPRLASLVAASLLTLGALGATGAALGGAPKWKGSLRVLLGGGMAMAITYGIGRLFTINAGGGEGGAKVPLSA